MSINRNGYIRDSLDMYPSEDMGSSSSEEIFHGFQKLPKVVCEKLNIMPYLHKMELDLRYDLPEPVFVPMRDIGKYTTKCSVKLRRENLEKLKEIFMDQSKRSYVYTTSFTCNICQKVYLSEKKLLNHQHVNKHVNRPESSIRKKVSFSDEIIIHKLNEYHRCPKCPKTYKKKHLLDIHTKKMHKKSFSYICFYCQKDFNDRMFFKAHIKLHCDACGLLLPNKKCYNEHRRTICKIIKKYECKTCHITLFYFMDLKDHSYEHLGNFYICDICKDRFDDKCALSHHIKFLHSKQRPKSLYGTHIMGDDRLYICKFCDENSVNQDTIEKHVSTFPEYDKCAMTGYKNFYFCNQCFEKFSTETDMLQHKWTHFLKIMHPNENQPKPLNVTSKTDAELSAHTINQPVKTIYNLKNDKLPPLLQAKIILHKLPFPQQTGILSQSSSTNKAPIDLTNSDFKIVDPRSLKKPIIEKKKTLLSKHQCELCLRYFSSNFTLRRHSYTVHGVVQDPKTRSAFCGAKRTDLRCSDCEEDFALPSLLKNHNCIRKKLTTPTIQNATPNIQLDTSVSQHNSFDDIDNYDYMNSIDFDIPAPIVEWTEYENVNLVINDDMSVQSNGQYSRLSNIVAVNNDRQSFGQLNNIQSVNNMNQISSLTNSNRLLMEQSNRVPNANDALSNIVPVITRSPNIPSVINVPINNDKHNTRQINNVPFNDRLDGQLNTTLPVNNRLSGQLNTTVPVNNRLRCQLNTIVPFMSMNGQLNTTAPFNDRLSNQLNMIIPVSDRLNGQLNTTIPFTSNNGKHLRYIYVQEVPIEF